MNKEVEKIRHDLDMALIALSMMWGALKDGNCPAMKEGLPVQSGLDFNEFLSRLEELKVKTFNRLSK